MIQRRAVEIGPDCGLLDPCGVVHSPSAPPVGSAQRATTFTNSRERTSLRPYFYDDAPLPEDAALASRAMTMAEMWADLFEQVIIQISYLPEDRAPAWKQYAIDMHDSSPAIQRYFEESCHWYAKELKELWGCSQP